MKRTLTLLLTLVMLLPLIASCSDPVQQPADTTVGGTTAPDETVDIFADIPKEDYNEHTFTICSPEPWGNTYFDSTEMTSDTVNDAIYTRNREIEARFNIVIRAINNGYTDNQAGAFQSFYASGEDVIDLLAVAPGQSGKPMITSGYVLPWNEIEHINLQKPWWNESVTKTLAILDNYYYLSGDINWARMLYTSVYYFNKDVAAMLQIPDLYQMVRDGKWTQEAMMNMAKTATTENGDGTWDEKDSYGLLQNYYTYEAWVAGANYHTVRFVDGEAKMQYATTKFKTLLDRLYEMMYTTHTCDTNADTHRHKTMFFDNRALFMCNQLQTASAFREEETDFGILPLPKYDEAQKQYTTYCDQWGLVMALPCTATNTSRTGAITEALCALSLKYVRPAYYDRTLLGKGIRDDESEEMLEIIFDGLIYDMGVNFITDLALMPYRDLLSAGNTNIASWWKKRENRITTNYTELFDYVKVQKGITE